ncbi:MAG: hypothetical protein JST12_13720 [Armatimonadetes bacterium]|nr:hypothetical protein [Armatimonadota bacterium]
MRRAVIDVGSNSVLLLVSEDRDGVWVPIHENTSVTALGEGTKQTGLLSEAAMERTLAAVHRFSNEAKGLGVEEIVIGATMAARIATNRDDFLARAARQGTPMMILSGEQEAQLGFEAVVNDPAFHDQDRISIVDPGGHSTELVTADRVGSEWNVEFRRSYPVGSLALKSTIFPNERSGGLEMLKGAAALDEEIGLCYRPNACGTVVVLGAAGTNLVSLREKLSEWRPDIVHEAILTYEEISRAVGNLMPMSDSERAALVGMEKGREKTIHLGALILERFLFALRAEFCYVSVRGWRHALLENPRLESISS